MEFQNKFQGAENTQTGFELALTAATVGAEATPEIPVKAVGVADVVK